MKRPTTLMSPVELLVLTGVCLITAFAGSDALANTYTYDAQGRVVSVVYDDGSRFTYNYDANSNLLSVTSAQAGFADLFVTTLADADPALIGEPLTYTVTVTNNGPDPVDDALVMNTPPLFFDVQNVAPNQGTCTISSGRFVDCNLGYLGVGASAVVQIAGSPTRMGQFVLVATVSSIVSDANTANNSDSVSVAYVDGDTDGDGLLNSEEIAGSASGDGNNDGVADHLQSHVASLETGVGRGGVTIEVGGGCPFIEFVSAAPANVIPQPDSYFFPFGLVAFTLPCPAADVSIYYSDSADLTGAAYRMYAPTLPGDLMSATWASLPGVALEALDFGAGVFAAAAHFTLTDGQLGDETAADGNIVAAPGGVAFQKPGPAIAQEIAWDPQDASLPFSSGSELEYTLPFPFTFFGRAKDRISVNETGLIELLGPGESCVACDAEDAYAEQLHVGVIDAIFAGNGGQEGAVTIQGTSDHVEVMFLMVRDFDNKSNQALVAQIVSVTLLPDGRIQQRLFSFFQGDIFEDGGDTGFDPVFVGLYSKTGTELGIDAANNLDGIIMHEAFEYTPGGSWQPIPWTQGDDQLGIDFDSQEKEITLESPYPFFARTISAVHMARSGFLELLEAGESCVDCTGELSHAIDLPYIFGYDAIFAANDVITEGLAVARRKLDGVEVTWVGAFEADVGPGTNPLTFSVRLHDSGQIEWRFFDMAYVSYYGDIFSGAYDASLGQEFEIEGGTAAFNGVGVHRRFTVDAPADLWVENRSRQDPTEVGNNITFDVTVGNIGPKEALDVRLTDTMPPGTTFISASTEQGTCTASAGVVNCALGDLPTGAQVAVTVVLRADISGFLENRTQVTSADFDNDTRNNESLAYAEVTPKPDDAELEITMADSQDPVSVGAQVEYVLTVLNHGLGEASGVAVVATLPALPFVSAVPEQGACTELNGIVTCELANLASGAESTVTLRLTADAVGPYTAEATVTGFANDPNPGNNTATEDTTVEPASPDAGVMDAQPTVDASVDAGSDSGPDAGLVLDVGTDPEELEGCGCHATETQSPGLPHGMIFLVAISLFAWRRHSRL